MPATRSRRLPPCAAGWCDTDSARPPDGLVYGTRSCSPFQRPWPSRGVAAHLDARACVRGSAPSGRLQIGKANRRPRDAPKQSTRDARVTSSVQQQCQRLADLVEGRGPDPARALLNPSRDHGSHFRHCAEERPTRRLSSSGAIGSSMLLVRPVGSTARPGRQHNGTRWGRIHLHPSGRSRASRSSGGAETHAPHPRALERSSRQVHEHDDHCCSEEHRMQNQDLA